MPAHMAEGSKLALLAHYARRYRGTLVLIALSGCLLGVPDVVAAWLIKDLVNGDRIYDWNAWFPVLGVIFALFAAKGAVVYFNNKSTLSLSFDVTCDVQKSLFDGLVRLEISKYLKEEPGDFLSRIAVSAGNVQQVLLAIARLFPGEGVQVIVYLAAIAVISPTIFAASFVLSVPYAVLLHFQHKTILKRSRRAVDQRAKWMSRLEELLHFFERMRGLHTEDLESAQFAEMTEKTSEMEKDLNVRQALVAPFLELVLGAGIFLVAALAIREMYQGALKVGDILAITGLILLVIRPINRIVVSVGTIKHNLSHLDRLTELFRFMDADRDARASGREFVKTSTGDLGVELDGIELAYDGGPKILDGVSLSWRGPGLLVITGRSGAGKTTLARIVAGMMTPSGGEVRLSTRGERPDPVVYLPQHLGLLNRTLLENVSYPDPEHDEQKVRAQLGQLGLERLFATELEGDQRLAGSGGSLVSEGEKKRIGLANLFYRDHEILLLDEPITGINEGLVDRVIAYLKRLSRDRLIVVVTHEEKLLAAADRVFFLSAGRIAGEGAHAELLAASDEYRANLAEEQER